MRILSLVLIAIALSFCSQGKKLQEGGNSFQSVFTAGRGGTVFVLFGNESEITLRKCSDYTVFDESLTAPDEIAAEIQDKCPSSSSNQKIFQPSVFEERFKILFEEQNSSDFRADFNFAELYQSAEGVKAEQIESLTVEKETLLEAKEEKSAHLQKRQDYYEANPDLVTDEIREILSNLKAELLKIERRLEELSDVSIQELALEQARNRWENGFDEILRREVFSKIYSKDDFVKFSDALGFQSKINRVFEAFWEKDFISNEMLTDGGAEDPIVIGDEQVVYVRVDEEYSRKEIRLLDIKTKLDRFLLSHQDASSVSNPQLLSDGRILYHVYRVIDGSTRISGTWVFNPNDERIVPQKILDRAAGRVFSDGNLYFHENSRLHYYDWKSEESRAVTDKNSFFVLALSDGRIVYRSKDERDQYSLWIVDPKNPLGSDHLIFEQWSHDFVEMKDGKVLFTGKSNEDNCRRLFVYDPDLKETKLFEGIPNCNVYAKVILSSGAIVYEQFVKERHKKLKIFNPSTAEPAKVLAEYVDKGFIWPAAQVTPKGLSDGRILYASSKEDRDSQDLWVVDPSREKSNFKISLNDRSLKHDVRAHDPFEIKKGLIGFLSNASKDKRTRLWATNTANQVYKSKLSFD